MLSKIIYRLNRYLKNRQLEDRKLYWLKNAESYTEENTLTPDEMKQLDAFYGKYHKYSWRSHSYYKDKTGKFDPKYLPHELHFCYIDPYLNDWEAAKYLDNKCLYWQLFPNVKQPRTVAMRVNGFWLNEKHQLISQDDLKQILDREESVVLKRATASAGGRGIYFFDKNIASEVVAVLPEISEDIMIQELFQQHPDIERINPNCLNSIRVMSLLSEEGVKILSAIIRLSVNHMRVDNISAGGIACAIRPDGSLNTKAAGFAGIWYEKHPTSQIAFADCKIPSYPKVLEKIKELHLCVPHFRLVAWDFTIDTDGEPVLIEPNVCNGGMDILQLNNGPLFGEDTEKILQEVFGQK